MSDDVESWIVPAKLSASDEQRFARILSLLLHSKQPNIRRPVRVEGNFDASTVTGSSSSQFGNCEERTIKLIFRRWPSCVTLHDYVKRKDVPLQARKNLAYQLVRSIAYLQSCSIYHNFLTSDDIIVDDSKDDKTPLLLLSNFFASSVTQTSNASYNCSRNYRPPEIIMGYEGRSASVDSWIVGCLLFEICTGEAAFSLLSSKEKGKVLPLLLKQQIQQIVLNIGVPSKDSFPQCYNPRHRDQILLMEGGSQLHDRLRGTDGEEWLPLLSLCLRFDPLERVDIATLVGHSFFDGLESDAEAVPPFDVALTLDGALHRSPDDATVQPS